MQNKKCTTISSTKRPRITLKSSLNSKKINFRYKFSRIITNIVKKIPFAWTSLTVILYKKIILLQFHYAHVILGSKNQIHFVRYLEFASNRYTLRLRKGFDDQIVFKKSNQKIIYITTTFY